jgi:hypothetical protein
VRTTQFEDSPAGVVLGLLSLVAMGVVLALIPG